MPSLLPHTLGASQLYRGLAPWSQASGASTGVGKVCPWQVAQGLASLSPALLMMLKLLGKNRDISQAEHFSKHESNPRPTGHFNENNKQSTCDLGLWTQTLGVTLKLNSQCFQLCCALGKA